MRVHSMRTMKNSAREKMLALLIGNNSSLDGDPATAQGAEADEKPEDDPRSPIEREILLQLRTFESVAMLKSC